MDTQKFYFQIKTFFYNFWVSVFNYNTKWNEFVKLINQLAKLVKPGDTSRNGYGKCDLWYSRGHFDTIGSLRGQSSIQIVSHSVVLKEND